MSNPHRIVFANEKGGTGKSTTAVHVAIALAYLGCRVAAIDLDPRQRTFHRYLENRLETENAARLTCPMCSLRCLAAPPRPNWTRWPIICRRKPIS